jgi:hypothetical protein
MLAIHASRMKRSSKIVFGSIIALFVLLMLAIIVPSLPHYSFTSVSEARAFAGMEDAEIVDELGDTNGPYRLRGGAVSGRNTYGKNFDFDLTFNGHTTNWNRLVSSNTSYVVTIFENRRGNQFAVVRKRAD